MKQKQIKRRVKHLTIVSILVFLVLISSGCMGQPEPKEDWLRPKELVENPDAYIDQEIEVWGVIYLENIMALNGKKLFFYRLEDQSWWSTDEIKVECTFDINANIWNEQLVVAKGTWIHLEIVYYLECWSLTQIAGRF